MGLIPLWHNDVLESLLACNIHFEFIEGPVYKLIFLQAGKLVLNLVSPDDGYTADALAALQNEHSSKGIFLVHLWKDVWLRRKDQVMSRIASVLGLNKSIHGRKTSIVKIPQQEAAVFLDQHHLLGAAKSKYRFALHLDERIVAVACFSNLRYMKKGGPDYRSAELIRFATLSGYTVTGGFTKLLRYFIDLYRPDDVMSYADRDWSLGQAYKQAGFILAEVTPPAEIWLDQVTSERHFMHRLKAGTDQQGLIKIFNTGNLKYILYLQPVHHPS